MKSRLVVMLSIFFALSFCSAALCSSSPITLSTIKSHYANKTSLVAEILQTKESKYFYTPIKSEITLRMENDQIDWIVKTPVKSHLRIKGNTIYTVNSASKTEEMAANDKASEIISFVRALIVGDFKKIESIFNLTLKNGESGVNVLAKPKKSPSLFQEIDLRFDQNLKLNTLTLLLPGEKLTMKFLKLEYGKPHKSRGSN